MVSRPEWSFTRHFEGSFFTSTQAGAEPKAVWERYLQCAAARADARDPHGATVAAGCEKAVVLVWRLRGKGTLATSPCAVYLGRLATSPVSQGCRSTRTWASMKKWVPKQWCQRAYNVALLVVSNGYQIAVHPVATLLFDLILFPLLSCIYLSMFHDSSESCNIERFLFTRELWGLPFHSLLVSQHRKPSQLPSAIWSQCWCNACSVI